MVDSVGEVAPTLRAMFHFMDPTLERYEAAMSQIALVRRMMRCEVNGFDFTRARQVFDVAIDEALEYNQCVFEGTGPVVYYPDVRCSYCFASTTESGEALMKCARCRAHSYCSKYCQKA